MKNVFGYTRVSTPRQGEYGVSLAEQKKAIQRYATVQNFNITHWYEERETAAKQGRAVFREMIQALNQGQASGVIAHKIDRSARNLRDWADLVDLADRGIEVHFSNESIDMQVRGGRLSADIQAVVAADYIRNLREETMKGIRGRLEQGYYPWPAPIGYLNRGGGKTKEIDAMKGPLVVELFKLYASGDYSLNLLAEKMNRKGLTNLQGRPVSINTLSLILNNPFYTGIMYVDNMKESFVGNHQPLIDKSLFDRVHRVLRQKTVKGTGTNAHTYRRLFTCVRCQRSVIGEKQKGQYIYYRCHLCSGVCVKEEAIEQGVHKLLAPVITLPQLDKDIDVALSSARENQEIAAQTEKRTLNLRKDSLDSKLDLLADALVENRLDQDMFQRKKRQIVEEVADIKSQLGSLDQTENAFSSKKGKNLELLKQVYKQHPFTDDMDKRDIIRKISSNRTIDGKKVVIEPYAPFGELLKLLDDVSCAPRRGRPRTSSHARVENSVREKLARYLETEE